MSWAVASAAVLCLLAVLYFGRRDLTHPIVAFGSIFFAFVTLAQIRLTPFEKPWSAEFALVVFGGALLFVAAALLTAGSRGVRGSFAVKAAEYRSTRLLFAALILLCGGAIGLTWKARILGGVPLFSGQIDVLRQSAFGNEGEIVVPAWSTFLTDGFYLAFWCLGAALWAGPTLRRSLRWIIVLLMVAALIGVLSEGSRNLLLLALAMPALALYWTWRLPGILKVAVGVGAAFLVVALLGAFFVVRINQRAGSADFVSHEVKSAPVVLQPFVPIYMGGVFTLETERRLMEAVPARFSYGLGTYTLQGLPDRLFPNGKNAYSDALGSLTYTDAATTPYWTVATYQGRALADFGVSGVVIVSALLGVLFGIAYRACRGGTRLFSVAALAYVTYYCAFLFYDNLASIAVMAVIYDLGVLAAVDILSRSPGPGDLRGSIFTARQRSQQPDS